MNSLVDVVKFFSNNVFEDLQAAAETVEPIRFCRWMPYGTSIPSGIRCVSTLLLSVL